MMTRKNFLAAGGAFPVAMLTALPSSRGTGGGDDYLRYVVAFADTLLDKGRDPFGARKTALWASVIDTRTLTVPSSTETVSDPPGTRSGDRAVGGSNLLHDVVTQRAFRALSAVTGNKKYGYAADAYLRDTLRFGQNRVTGLLAWGEHLYCDLLADEGAVNARYREQKYGGLWHELIAWTPPWRELWSVDRERTVKAIAGLRYHFHDTDATTALFNRHATWDKASYQTPEDSQPWIKHSGLYAHAFYFLYARTNDTQWLRRARNVAVLYWDKRNTDTGLTIGCIGDPRPETQQASLGGTASLAYWLYKAYIEVPAEKPLRDRALALLKAYDRAGYDRKRDGYRPAVTLNGTPVGGDALTPSWAAGYGEGSLPKFGRMAAYLAAKEKDGDCLEMARRVARIVRRDQIPATIVAEPVAYALGLSLDLYDLTRESAYLADARRYADLAVEKFWRNGLFTRQTNDPFYEAKIGTGDLVAGLLRLHLRLHPSLDQVPQTDWSV